MLGSAIQQSFFSLQVFSVVPFTQYHQEAVADQSSYLRMDVNHNNGHFDTYNYDHVSFYVADYVAGRLHWCKFNTVNYNYTL